MNPNDPCPTCGKPLEAQTSNVPKPHYARLACADGHHAAWLPAPMTYERAAGFRMPFGKYRDKTIAEIAAVDLPYLAWASGTMQGSIARMIERFAAGPDSISA